MKKIILTIVWAIFWLSVESTLFHLDFVVFVSVMAVAFSFDLRDGFVPVAIMGIITDAISITPFGINTVAYLAALALIRFVTSTIYLQSGFARFVWTIIASGFTLWLKAVLTVLVLHNTIYLTHTLLRLIPQAVFNGLAGIIIIPAFLWYLDITLEKLTRPKGLVLS